MKCHYLYAAAILICAGAIGAEEIPVPEKLKPHVLYRNGFDNAASLRDPSCKWKPRTNNSEIRAGGITRKRHRLCSALHRLADLRKRNFPSPGAERFPSGSNRTNRFPTARCG